jgi:hypothetical protein
VGPRAGLDTVLKRKKHHCYYRELNSGTLATRVKEQLKYSIFNLPDLITGPLSDISTKAMRKCRLHLECLNSANICVYYNYIKLLAVP